MSFCPCGTTQSKDLGNRFKNSSRPKTLYINQVYVLYISIHTVQVYILYIRSHLEQSCQVWHSSLTLENLTDIERVQKNALKIILQGKYVSYTQALEVFKLQRLYCRREELCLSFARKCTKSKNTQVRALFPPNNAHSTVETQESEKYHVNMAKTGRYKKSAVPYMQRLLNKNKWTFISTSLCNWSVSYQAQKDQPHPLSIFLLWIVVFV